MSQQLSTLLAVCPAAPIASFLFTQPVLSRLPLSCVHGPVARLWSHICSLLRSLHLVDCTVNQQCPCCVKSQQSQDVKILSALSSLLSMSAGLLSLSTFISRKRLLSIASWQPECFDIKLLHLARSTPRHHAASCSRITIYTRNGSRHPISVRNCFNWMPHAAARVAAYNSVAPLEMTPGVIEHVSATDFKQFDHDTITIFTFHHHCCPIAISQIVKVFQLCSR